MQTTNLDSPRDKDGKLLKGAVINPTGKGGFQERPEDISPGGWKKENTISYQYNRFMNMTPDELVEWSKTPNSERTVAMDLAYGRVLAARKSLADIKEITDRTEGKAPQLVENTGESKIIVETRHADNHNSSTPSV